MRRLRVLVVAACPFPCPRGTPIRVQRTAESLAARGHAVEVATYHLGDGSETAGLTLHRIGETSFYRNLSAGPTLTKFLWLDPRLLSLVRRLVGSEAGGPYDLLYAHHYEGLGIALAARGTKPLPVVYDAHTILSSELPHYAIARPRRLAAAVGAFLDRRLPARATRVVAVTDAVRRMLVERCGVDSGRASVVPNGVEEGLIERCRALPRPPGPRDTLVYSGNLARFQGLDLLLRALLEVRRARPGARLLVATSESAAAPLRRLESEAARLGVAGAVEIVRAGFDRLPEALARADVALDPRPQGEGLSQKVLNYMAAGKAVVAFRDAGGALEHERTGLLVSDPTPAAFARSILRLLDDGALASRLGDAARATVAARFTWQIAAGRIEEVFARAIADGGARADLSADAPAAAAGG